MTKNKFLLNISNKRVAEKSSQEIAQEIFGQKTDLDRIRSYFYYYPQASFKAFWLEYGNTLTLSKKQAKALCGEP